MSPAKLLTVVLQNIGRNRKNFVFSCIGITVGVCVFSFFVALTVGIREEVLNRIYPVELIEVEPASVNIAGTRSNVEKVPFSGEGVRVLGQVQGIAAVFPKLRSKLQATYRLGGQLFGQNGVTFEAYFDGLDDTLLRGELMAGEAQRSRKSVRDRLREKYGRDRRCYGDEDCSPNEQCAGGVCREIEYWTRFADHGEYLACTSEQLCAEGYSCVQGQCRRLCDAAPGCYDGEACVRPACSVAGDCGAGTCDAGVCSAGVCLRQCPATACLPGEECVPGECRSHEDCVDGTCIQGRCALAGTCAFMRCVQPAMEEQVHSNPDLARGERPGMCEDGTPRVEGVECPLARCPTGSYCSVHTYFRQANLWKDKRGEGRCEQPVPAVLNPLVLELFNMVLGSTLDRTQLGTLDTLLGYQGAVTFGHSFYKETVKDRTPVGKRIMVVGFSNKALEAGVTMPMEYVKRANTRYKGKKAADEFDSMILQLSSAEFLPDVMKKMEQFNIQLSRRSAEAEKFRTVLLVAIAIFFIMASIILGIAATNITHTFLMVIYERKREIGILRALGATKMDIRLIFLVESLFIGVAGGLMGNGIAVGLSTVADWLANRYIGDFPFQPDSFFLFQPEWMAASFGFAVFFSLVGAFFPANRAAAMDPAKTLTLP
jgi:ABC-type lipoprotein release transport system permease subunit